MNETDMTPTTSEVPMQATDATASPRTRWAAILWGVVFAAVAIGALWLFVTPEGRDAYADWLVGLTPLTAVSTTILVIGGLVLVSGIAGIARRLQRRAGASRSRRSPR